MSISRPWVGPHSPAPRALALEALGLAVFLGFLPQLAGSRSGMALAPHPGWIAVLVLTARYGSRGLFAGLIAVAGAVVGAAVITRTGFPALWNMLHSGPSLIAFGGCLAVSWIASGHLRRQAALTGRVHVLRQRWGEAREVIVTLRTTVATLRGRVDRTSSSLSFVRDAAARLGGRDPVAAAQAAADLALARTGASAAAVRVGPGGFHHLLAVRDTRWPRTLQPLDARNADLSVPIRDGNECLGVLTLWGVSGSDGDEATTHELAVIASWCAAALRPLSVSGAGGRPVVGLS
jgi:hypothetical protein